MESIPSLRLCEFIHRISLYFAVLYRSTLLGFDKKKRSVLYSFGTMYGCADRVPYQCSLCSRVRSVHTVIIIMSGTGPRESIFATRMALTNTKTRLKGAQTGHSLLAKKRDALTTRFRAILRKVDEVS
jgi:ATP synthase subunit D